MNVSERLDFLLKRKGWSVSELARRLDINNTAIHDWKRKNRIPASRLLDVAQLLDTNIGYLQGDIDDPDIEKDKDQEMIYFLLEIGYFNADGTVNQEMKKFVKDIARAYREGKSSSKG